MRLMHIFYILVDHFSLDIYTKYDEIFEGKLKLIPPKEGIEVFSRDFSSMQNMLFGTKISFDKIIEEINKYEKEFNRLLSKYKE